MVITFSAVLFSLLFLFSMLRKNTFFLFYVLMMILCAYVCENNLNWQVHPFSKISFMLFLLFHIPLINICTFLAYGRDKSLAKRGEWRIPETHLHTLELLGGTIGAFIGQKVFHHKNKKRSYAATFLGVVAIQVGIILYILYYLKIL